MHCLGSSAGIADTADEQDQQPHQQLHPFNRHDFAPSAVPQYAAQLPVSQQPMSMQQHLHSQQRQLLQQHQQQLQLQLQLHLMQQQQLSNSTMVGESSAAPSPPHLLNSALIAALASVNPSILSQALDPQTLFNLQKMMVAGSAQHASAASSDNRVTEHTISSLDKGTFFFNISPVRDSQDFHFKSQYFVPMSQCCRQSDLVHLAHE
jgi:hypothetical protein